MSIAKNRKFIIVCFLLCSLLICFGILLIGIKAYANVSDGSENIISYTDENGVDRMGFDIVHGYSPEQSVLVQVLSSAETGQGVLIAGIVLLSVGAAGLVGAVLWMVLTKKKKQSIIS